MGHRGHGGHCGLEWQPQRVRRRAVWRWYVALQQLRPPWLRLECWPPFRLRASQVVLGHRSLGSLEPSGLCPWLARADRHGRLRERRCFAKRNQSVNNGSLDFGRGFFFKVKKPYYACMSFSLKTWN